MGTVIRVTSEEETGYNGSRYTRSIDLGARVACKSCNNGWMSALEAAVKPMLNVLCSGQAAEVTPAALKVIAFWAVKTAVVCTYSIRGKKGVDDNVREWLFKSRETFEPPNHAPVWVATYEADDAQATHLVKLFPRFLELRDPNRPEFAETAFDFTFALGRLVLKAIILPSSLWKFSTVVEFQEPKSVFEIWPNPEGNLDWPLTTSHQEEDLAGLSFAMVGNYIEIGK